MKTRFAGLVLGALGWPVSLLLLGCKMKAMQTEGGGPPPATVGSAGGRSGTTSNFRLRRTSADGFEVITRFTGNCPKTSHLL